MSLPSPTDRREIYLNAIATGETSDLPTPSTREEVYLDYIAKNGSGGGGGGTSNYEQLSNKPQINGVTLSGNKSADDLNLASKTDVIGKADKVETAVAGHLAGLDSNGNLTDSGVSPTEDVTVEGNPVTFDSPFEQDAKSVVVTVKPIQDLHGYDYPWPAGGGKNLLGLIFTEEPSTVVGLAFTHTESSFTLKGTSNSDAYRIIPLNYLPNIKGNTTYCLTAIVDKGSFNGLYISIAFRKDGAQVKRVTLNTGSALSIPFDNIPEYDEVRFILEGIPASTQYDLEARIQIEEGGSFTSFAPYSNICPISGIDEVEIEVSGKNLFDESSTQNGYFDNSGNLISNAGWKSDYIDVTEGINYRISGCNEIIGGAYFIWFDSNKNKISIVSEHKNGIYLAPTNAFYLGVSEATGNENISVTIDHTTTIPLPSTLYGGTVRVDEGNAVVDIGGVDLGTLDWTEVTGMTEDTYCYKATVANILSSDEFYIDAQSDGYEFIGVRNEGWIKLHGADGKFYIKYNGSEVYFCDARCANATAFANFVNGMIMDFALATPTTISFEPMDVELLEGTNVVSTNGEKVAVTYGRSLWQDIDELKTDTEGKLNKSDVADIEGDTASKAYSVNDFMLRADGLYKVTAPIAQNASITASNTTKTTIGAVLTALLNA